MDNKRNNPNYTSDRIMMAVIIGIIISCFLRFKFLRELLVVLWCVEILALVVAFVYYLNNK